MSNMSYVRFQNTLADLEDCADALKNCDPDDLGVEEYAAAIQLIELCQEIGALHQHLFD